MTTVSIRRSRGSVLVVAIVFLLLLSTLALTGLRSSTTNVQIVGNMQARQEVTAAAQMLIERTVSTDEFATNPGGLYIALGKAGGGVKTDFNGDGTPDTTAWLEVEPVCLRARAVPLNDLDPSNSVDAACFASASLANPGLVTGGGAPAGTLCADTEWEIVASAADPQTNATVTLHQGVSMRAPIVGLSAICN